MFNLQHFLHGRDSTELNFFTQIRFQKAVGKYKFTPSDMKCCVNNDDDDDEKNNHENNNEQYTYSIVGSYFQNSTLYFII